MDHYFFQQEANSPPQHILLDQLLPRAAKPSTRYGDANTPEEVAAIIADDMLESVKSSFADVGSVHLLTK